MIKSDIDDLCDYIFNDQQNYDDYCEYCEKNGISVDDVHNENNMHIYAIAARINEWKTLNEGKILKYEN